MEFSFHKDIYIYLLRESKMDFNIKFEKVMMCEAFFR